MKKNLTLLFFALFTSLSFFSFAQEENSALLQTEVLEIQPLLAQVVGILEGNERLAVLQLLEADEYPCMLDKGEEILVTFYFGSGGRASEPVLARLKGGDIISAELHCTAGDNPLQQEYTIFRYTIIPPAPKE